MNARKYTTAQVADLAGLPEDMISALLRDHAELAVETVAAVAVALQVEPSQLAGNAQRDCTVISQAPEALHDSRRPIQRDGIHFYNYYTMAAPPGRVAPVILDILCPADRIPALNNGHLEPAITVNLGPGHIHGRWGEPLTAQTWQVLAANTDDDAWITGDSYVEPSHCRHSYSLVGETPARIVSYTAESNIARLADDVNAWSDSAFARYLDYLDRGMRPADLLDLLLARRGHDRETAAAAAGLLPGDLEAAAADPVTGLPALRAVGRALGFDYRIVMPADRSHDEIGKTCLNVADARRSQRRFGPYEVASTAGAPHLPDLTGLFVRIDADRPTRNAFLTEPAECHYFVTSGEVTLEWADAGGEVVATKLTADGSAWVGPFVQHAWYGHGSVLKFGSGVHVGYLDLLELTNTYAPGAAARRSRRDVASWGYDR
jgi:2-hydroxyethylphosphonate dioxygenase